MTVTTAIIRTITPTWWRFSEIILSGATYSKMVQNLWWAAGYNALAIPLDAGALYPLYQFLLPPAVGAVVMSLSTVIVAVNAKLLSV